MRFKIVLLFFILPCLVITAGGKGNPVLEKVKIVAYTSHGVKIPITVECARTESEHTYGLMFREKMGENEGMLFVFGSDGYRNFWMKNTIIPLSIAYISVKGIILEIQDMKPMNEKITYPSKYPCRYALEMNKGWFEKKDIKPGSKIEFDFK